MNNKNEADFHIPNTEQASSKIQLDFLACLLADAGVTRWMVSPGSRNAPLVASMVKHGGCDLHSGHRQKQAGFEQGHGEFRHSPLLHEFALCR